MKNFLIISAAITITLLIILTLLYKQTATKNESVEKITDLPWMVTINPDRSSTIFNQTLGKSTLEDFQGYVKRQPEVSLFRDQDASFTVEALFEKINLGGLVSHVILELNVPKEELAELEKNSLKKTVMPSGAYKLRLSTETINTLANKTITNLTYSPTSVRLDAEMIKLRFGEPDEIITVDDKISHFLYPQIGLDIILNLNKRAKDVFQYVNPDDFDRLREKLYSDAQITN